MSYLAIPRRSSTRSHGIACSTDAETPIGVSSFTVRLAQLGGASLAGAEAQLGAASLAARRRSAEARRRAR